MKKWYDVHFSLNGFMKIRAKDEEDAAQKVGGWLEENVEDIEKMIKTGIGVEVYEVLEVEEEAVEEEATELWELADDYGES